MCSRMCFSGGRGRRWWRRWRCVSESLPVGPGAELLSVLLYSVTAARSRPQHPEHRWQVRPRPRRTLRQGRAHRSVSCSLSLCLSCFMCSKCFRRGGTVCFLGKSEISLRRLRGGEFGAGAAVCVGTHTENYSLEWTEKSNSGRITFQGLSMCKCWICVNPLFVRSCPSWSPEQ